MVLPASGLTWSATAVSRLDRRADRGQAADRRRVGGRRPLARLSARIWRRGRIRCAETWVDSEPIEANPLRPMVGDVNTGSGGAPVCRFLTLGSE